MNKVNKLYNKIISIGESNSNTNVKNKQIRLLNTYALITMHFTILMPIGDFFSGFLNTTIIGSYVFIFINMLLVLLLNKRDKYFTATFIWILGIMINIFLFSIVMMPGYYNEYYYAFLPGIALSLYKKITIPIVVTVMSFVLFLVPYYVIGVYSEEVVNHLDISAIIGLFLIFFFLVNYFKKNNLKSEEELKNAFEELEERRKIELRSEQAKSLKTKINPHFVFNSVNAIQALVLKGDKYEAYQYLSKFSNVIRDGVKANDQNFVSLGKELSLLKKYLELEKLRFQTSFEYDIEVNHIYENDLIPSVLIQPFIEDVMYRLFHSKAPKKIVKIKVTKNEELSILIKDNGISHSSLKILKVESGLNDKISTIDQKINLFNHCYQIDIDYDIKYTGEEVVTTINIPYSS